MKRFNILLLFIVFASFTLTACRHPLERRESGDFMYCFALDSMSKKCVTIMELSEQGKQKETIVFPTEIDGLLVKSFGGEFGLRTEGKIESENLKQVYLHSQIELFINNHAFSELKGYTLYSGYSIDIYAYLSHAETIYVSKNDNIWLEDIDSDHEFLQKIKYANVIYYYNYDNKTVFFVDDCDGTIVNVTPPNPYREGYEFIGWYKEAECLNRWDFDKDIVPSKEYDEEGNYLLKETRLYAKWEKK